MRDQSVLISGYASLDSFISVEHLRGPGETSTVLAFEGFERPLPGGCACNIAVACARLGVKNLLVTVLGEDNDGLVYKELLKRVGVNTHFVHLVKGKVSPRTLLVSDQKGNQMTFYYPGASDHTVEALREELNTLEKLDLCYEVITVGDPRLTKDLVLHLYRKEIPILWSFKADMKAYPLDLIQFLLKATTYLVANEAEARLLQKLLDLGDISELIGRGLKGIVVTKGSKGCEVITDTGRRNVPPVQPARVIDSTGAGDGFVAGVLYGLYHEMSLLISAQIGATLASFVLEEWGAQTGLPDLVKLRARYCKNFGPWPVKEGYR